MVTTNVNCVTSGVVIWFCRKAAWRKLWSCRSLNFSFWTHFGIGTKQRNRIGLFVDCECQNLQWFSQWCHCFVNVWIINEVLHTLFCWTMLIVVVFHVYDGQRIHSQNKSNVRFVCLRKSDSCDEIRHGNNKFVLPRWLRPWYFTQMKLSFIDERYLINLSISATNTRFSHEFGGATKGMYSLTEILNN